MLQSINISKYMGSVPSRLVGEHIIIACDNSSRPLVEPFLDEFFHEVCIVAFKIAPMILVCATTDILSFHNEKTQDHGFNAKHLILLVPEDPDMGWKSLLLRYSANDRVTYIRGDPRQAKDIVAS